MLENRGQTAAAKTIYETLLAEDPHRLYVRMRLSLMEQEAGRYRRARACPGDGRNHYARALGRFGSRRA